MIITNYKLLQLSSIWVLISLIFCLNVNAEDYSKLYPDYPVEFKDGIAIISRIADKEIVLDDTLLEFSESFECYNSKGKTNINSFKVGDSVGVHLSSEEILQTLWLIKKTATTTSKSADTKKNISTDSKLIFENGKWRN